MKKTVLFGLLVIVLAFGFISCDDGNNEKTYSVTIGTLTNGSITANPRNGVEGTEITLTVTPDNEYQLKTGTLKYGTTAINETTLKFNLPAENVIVTAEFEIMEIPELRQGTVNLDFIVAGEPKQYTATVKGILTTRQWGGLASRIETAIQNAYNISSITRRGRFYEVFGQNMAVIVVEKDASFAQWDVKNKYLIHFNFNYLVGLSEEELVTNLIDAVLKMTEANMPLP